jgi:hypothetical protein
MPYSMVSVDDIEASARSFASTRAPRVGRSADRKA